VPPVAALTVRVDADITGATRGLDTVEQKVAGMGSRLGTVFSTAGGFLLAQGVQAVINNVGGMVDAALDFEAQMANVNSILKISGSDLANLSDQVLGLTTNPGITQGPADLAAGLYNVVSSGFEGAAALEVLEASALAATAGLTTTDVAAQVIVGTMNAYGHSTYTAAQIADVLFKTVDSGVVTFEQLASNMGQVLAVGASLGVGIDQLGAAYAQMTLNAVPAAQAETQLAALMRSALNPTDALTAAVQKQGFASAEALIAAEGMPGFLQVLIEEADGSKEALLGMVGSTEAMNAAIILGKDGVEEYNRLLFEMTGQLTDGGAMSEALEKQMLSAEYAIAKAKQQATVAATVFLGLFAPAIRAGAEAVSGFLSGGVIPFTNVISTAIRGGFEFRDVVDQLPRPLRATAGAVGTIAEGVGDLVRSFGERGLAGMLQTLTLGGEGRQILGGLRTLAEEGWDLFTGTLGTLVDAGVTLAPVLVRGAISLVGEVGDAAGRLYDWVKGKLFGVAGANGAGLTDGSGEGAAFLPLQSEPITFGDVVIEAGVQLVGGAGNIAGRVKEWIQGKLFGAPGGVGLTDGVSEGSAIIPSGFTYDIASISIDILDALINVSAEDVRGWIQDRFDEFDSISAEVKEWAIIITGDPTVTSASSESGGGDPISAILDWVDEQSDRLNGENGLAIDLTNKILRMTGNPDMQVDDFEGWNNLMQLAVQQAADEFAEIKADLHDVVMSIPGIDNVSIDIGFEVAELAQKIADKLPFPLNIPANIILDILLGNEPGTTPPASMPPPRDNPLGIPNGMRGVFSDLARQSFVTTDFGAQWFQGLTNAVNPQASEDQWLRNQLQPFIGPPAPDSGRVIPMKVDLDTTEAQAKLMALTGTTGNKADSLNSPFKATFDLDTDDASRKNTEALLWGTTWAGAEYTSAFNINDEDAIAKKTSAFLSGMNWAGSVFTATFAINMGPMETALTRTRQIAQEISDLLPNSPAKKGPLARPVSFGYIADNLEANLDRMAAATYRGMDRVGSAFGSSINGPGLGVAGAAGSSGNTTVIFVTPDSEQFSEIAREARRGGDFARLLPQMLREA
jgi:TP901 family phage tail tape measure protein